MISVSMPAAPSFRRPFHTIHASATAPTAFVEHAPSKTAEPAKKWGLPTLSQGAPFATRGLSGLSPFFRPVHFTPGAFIPIVVRHAMGTLLRAASTLVSPLGTTAIPILPLPVAISVHPRSSASNSLFPSRECVDVVQTITSLHPLLPSPDRQGGDNSAPSSICVHPRSSAANSIPPSRQQRDTSASLRTLPPNPDRQGGDTNL
jgi:hypothetical protein